MILIFACPNRLDMLDTIELKDNLWSPAFTMN